jgi:hypothetical protein
MYTNLCSLLEAEQARRAAADCRAAPGIDERTHVGGKHTMGT